MNPRLLDGLRVFVVEDEAMLFFMAEDMLTELGAAQVFHAARLAEALAFLDSERPDVAMLDVNLAGRLVYPVAEKLAAANIPFIFATGYGVAGLPAHLRSRPVIQKPFTTDMLGEALAMALGPDPEQALTDDAASRAERQARPVQDLSPGPPAPPTPHATRGFTVQPVEADS